MVSLPLLWGFDNGLNDAVNQNFNKLSMTGLYRQHLRCPVTVFRPPSHSSSFFLQPVNVAVVFVFIFFLLYFIYLFFFSPLSAGIFISFFIVGIELSFSVMD